MKQKDLSLIVVVAIVSVVVATLMSNLLFASNGAKQQQAEVVDAISWDFTSPDARYFNKDSIDPTEIIRIGESNNQTPFDTQGQ